MSRVHPAAALRIAALRIAALRPPRMPTIASDPARLMRHLTRS
ncbi:hypothetical protein [Streptomyces sp. NPDC056690]